MESFDWMGDFGTHQHSRFVRSQVRSLARNVRKILPEAEDTQCVSIDYWDTVECSSRSVGWYAGCGMPFSFETLRRPLWTRRVLSWAWYGEIGSNSFILSRTPPGWITSVKPCWHSCYVDAPVTASLRGADHVLTEYLGGSIVTSPHVVVVLFAVSVDSVIRLT
jgi:hypothetical protein